jgi:hypothetical protein
MRIPASSSSPIAWWIADFARPVAATATGAVMIG